MAVRSWRSAVAEHVQLGGDITQRRGAGGGLLKRPQRLGGSRVAVEQRAGHQPGEDPQPVRLPGAQPRLLHQRGQPGEREPPRSALRRVGQQRPARARCRTAATALAAITLTVADGRSTRAIALIASAGSSTYSSTLWQMTRSAAADPTRLSRLAASPCTEARRTPASAARRCAAASASGLGSTTVTLCPRAANGTASPPVPPPTSTMSRAGRPVAATRADTTALSTSQTSEERTPSRLKSTATRPM